MGKRVSERATRGDEGRDTAVSGHRVHVVRLGKPLEPVRTRRLRSLGSSWRSRARRLVCLVSRRRGGPPAHRPSGRGPGCGFASDRAIPPPSQAGAGFELWLGSHVCFFGEIRATWNKVTATPRSYVRGCAPPGDRAAFLGAGGRLPKARRGRFLIVKFFFFFVDRAASSVPWSDSALRRKFTSGASAA